MKTVKYITEVLLWCPGTYTRIAGFKEKENCSPKIDANSHENLMYNKRSLQTNQEGKNNSYSILEQLVNNLEIK